MNEKIKAVQLMQDYILKHVTEDISLADLANEASYSPWYAHRLFKELIGLSPAEYIRKIRLTEAAKQIKNDNCKIIDAAMEIGFESADGFTRAFIKEFGIKPSSYKYSHLPITYFVPYGVKFKNKIKENSKMENVRNVFVQVIKKPKRKVIIKRGIKAKEYWDYCKEVGCDVWGTLLSMDSLYGEPVCLWLPEKYILPNTSKYVQGVEVDENYSGSIPNGYDIITLPECEYLMFQGEPFEEEKYSLAIIDVQNALKKYDPTIIGYEWDNENPQIQFEPRGERGYIELKAIKRKK